MNLTSFVFVLTAGVLAGFLWLPLVPMIAPLVVLTLGLRWVAKHFLKNVTSKKLTTDSKHIAYPTQHVPQGQASKPTAWLSLANLPSPARAGSLPYSHKRTGSKKSLKRRLREERQVARLMNGLELRKQVNGY